MKDRILEIISKASLNQVLDINDFTEIDWIWINRGMYRDLLYNLKVDQLMDEDTLEDFIETISDEEFVDRLTELFTGEGYVKMNQYLFSRVEKGFKPTKDIETVIFLKEGIHRKYMIKIMNSYSWILKAMAMDTYFKMGLEYSSLKEVYEELFEENSRIVEALLSNQEYEYLTGKWGFQRKTEELLFYKLNELYQAWGEGEALARFAESIKR